MVHPPVVVPGVEPAGHDDGRARQRPMVGNVAEHEGAQDRDPDQQGVAVGLHGARLGMVERLDQRVVRQRAQQRGRDQQRRAESVRPLPLERPDQRGRGEGGERRPDQGRFGRVLARAQPHEDLIAGPHEGADQRQQQGPVERPEAGMHDQQHAHKARGDGQPARHAGALAQEQHAERDHDQRRGGGNGMGVGQRQVLEGQHEDGAFDHRQHRARRLQPGPPRAERRPQTAFAARRARRTGRTRRSGSTSSG